MERRKGRKKKTESTKCAQCVLCRHITMIKTLGIPTGHDTSRGTCVTREAAWWHTHTHTQCGTSKCQVRPRVWQLLIYFARTDTHRTVTGWAAAVLSSELSHLFKLWFLLCRKSPDEEQYVCYLSPADTHIAHKVYCSLYCTLYATDVHAHTYIHTPTVHIHTLTQRQARRTTRKNRHTHTSHS